MKEIEDSHLCTGCGTCAGICPTNAIEMTIDSEGIYRPSVNNHKCTGCGLCVKVCPGRLVDFNQLNEFVFGKISNDDSLGNCVDCYIGYSTDEEIRWNASSGGIVTALLIFALEEGIIDGALVTRMNRSNPLEPEIIMAKTGEDIISSTGSKYCPVPVNRMIKAILKQKGKFAVVGLPCHIHGIRKAEVADKRLKERIILHIGLFCSHVSSFLATRCLLARTSISENNVATLSYRGEGWPGNMSIFSKSGRKISIPYTLYWDCIFGPFFFAPVACTLCTDATNELADISVGDPWLPEFKSEKKGMTAIIARTEDAKKLLLSAMSNDRIDLLNLSCKKLKQSQMFNLNFKKKTVRRRANFLARLCKKKPRIIPEPQDCGIISYLVVILPLVSIYLSSQARLRSVLKYTPYLLLRTYFRFLLALLTLV